MNLVRDAPTLRELVLVVELAERRSFTAAAEAIPMSQSALSRAINETERRVGAKLFRRTTRSVELTPEGEQFTRHAREVLAGYRSALNEFALFRDGLSGLVRVAALPSVAAMLLPAAVAEMQDETPGIEVALEDCLAHVAVTRLLNGDADFALTTPEDLPDEVDFVPLVRDRFRVVFRPDHRFAERPWVGWRDLVREPVVMFGTSSSIRVLTDQVLDRLGLQPAESIEAQNVAVIAGLVSAGLGVAATPELVLPLMLFAGLLSAPLRDPTIEREVGLVTVRERPMSPAAERFAEHLRRRLSLEARAGVDPA